LRKFRGENEAICLPNRTKGTGFSAIHSYSII
jgi:hypothetical protein